VCLAFVEGELVDVRDERLADHWSYCKADVSKYIHSDPVGKDFLPICDVVNNFLNYNVAAGERIQPLVLGDPRVIDFDAMRKHRGTVADIIPALPVPGGDYTKAFGKFPVAEMSPELMQFSGVITEQGRQSTGILPPIFGGDSGKQTATEAEQKRVQALMQLNIPHNEQRSFWSSTYYNAAVLFGKNAVGGVQIPGILLTPEDTMAFAELAEGGFTYEAEEGMPMTWAQRRALTWSIVDKGPPVWELFSMGHPENKQKLLDAVGFPDWNIHQTHDKAKADKTIAMLLQQQPVMGPQGPQPSIPADEFEDDHKFMVDSVKEWAQKEDALRAKAENPLGYLNVIAWGRQHRFILMMSQMPPGPAGVPQGPPSGPQSSPGPSEGPPESPEPRVDPVDAGLGEPQA